MTLEEAWKLLGLLNDDANQQTKDLWSSENVFTAIRCQSECFRNNFLKLNNTQQQIILDWTIADDEFKDYFVCLFGKEEFTKQFL